jgi:hypothetical protein
MLELDHNGYYPLTKANFIHDVPERPGIYVLAVRLASGVHQTFYSGQSGNLYNSLQLLADGDFSEVPPIIVEYLTKYRCYFTYYVVAETTYRNEIAKMLAHTTDPVMKLTLLGSI